MERFEEVCQRCPLRLELRKPHAKWGGLGFRDIVLLGDLCQLPPASGVPPVAHTNDFQNRFEFFGLKENRRQEKDNAYAMLLDRIRRGGFVDGHEWSGICVEHYNEERDIIDDDVQEYFVQAYVRGWNHTDKNVDPDNGVVMCSYRRGRDKWNQDIVEQLEERYLHCEQVDVPCAYDLGGTA